MADRFYAFGRLGAGVLIHLLPLGFFGPRGRLPASDVPEKSRPGSDRLEKSGNAD